MRHYQHYIFLLLAFLMPTSKLSLSAKVFNEMVYSPQKTAFKHCQACRAAFVQRRRRWKAHEGRQDEVNGQRCVGKRDQG